MQPSNASATTPIPARDRRYRGNRSKAPSHGLESLVNASSVADMPMAIALDGQVVTGETWIAVNISGWPSERFGLGDWMIDSRRFAMRICQLSSTSPQPSSDDAQRNATHEPHRLDRGQPCSSESLCFRYIVVPRTYTYLWFIVTNLVFNS